MEMMTNVGRWRKYLKIEYIITIIALVVITFTFPSLDGQLNGQVSSQRYSEAREVAYLMDSEQIAEKSWGSNSFMQSSEMPVASRAMSTGQEAMSAPLENTAPEVQRRIQETHSIEMLGPNSNIKEFYDKATSLCNTEFCYINSGSINTNSSQSVGYINLRIKPDNLDAYLGSLMSDSNDLEIISRSRSAEDRTAQFADIEARKKSQEALRSRLVALVENYQGDEIRSLLEIERELARVQGQIESMDAQLRTILDVTELSTVNLTIKGKLSYAPNKEVSPVIKALNSSWIIIETNVAKMITLASAIAPWAVLLLVIFFSTKLLKNLFRQKTIKD